MIIFKDAPIFVIVIATIVRAICFNGGWLLALISRYAFIL
jgi:hypothetical protein